VLGCIGLSKISEIPISNQFVNESELAIKKTKKICSWGIALPIIVWIVGSIFVTILFFFILGY
jgi:hypothetical protein